VLWLLNGVPTFHFSLFTFHFLSKYVAKSKREKISGKLQRTALSFKN
jgi:hypothetical protein